jgi:hypothetical protein
MNCYECATQQRQTPAVAICKHCSVGLCMDHLAESRGFSAGGMRVACPHLLPTADESNTTRAASRS